jgi:hypothetical protein
MPLPRMLTDLFLEELFGEKLGQRVSQAIEEKKTKQQTKAKPTEKKAPDIIDTEGEGHDL